MEGEENGVSERDVGSLAEIVSVSASDHSIGQYHLYLTVQIRVRLFNPN